MKIGKEAADGAVGEGERQIKSLTGIRAAARCDSSRAEP
jgi:hypothetical protein